LLGTIPLDDEIVSSTNRGTPATLNGRSAAAKSLEQIALKLTGEELAPVASPGFFARIGRALGLSPAA
jgi:septum formation inhibitor-activating ATPase MinD